MLFNSVPFLVFLPVVFGVYWLLGRRAQNVLLLAASYLFYGWWDWRFLSLIVLSSLVDYWAGSRIDRGRARRAWLALSVGVNLGALGVFKYLGFGIESFARLLTALGFEAHLPTLSLVLPVGISFYTFQTLSYTIDIYRGRIRPTPDPVAFFTFVAFFPQLVAGPIERARNLLPQFEAERGFDRAAAADGMLQMLYGFWLKTVVADNLAMVTDWCFSRPEPAGWLVLFATYSFAFQIYGDFAGYSHIAIGCAKLFGISLMRNFAFPYLSRSPAELWKRWHISLSTWFRDYVYIPLGGSRCGPLRRRFNVVVTFVLSGLWHGAGFTYLLWGLYHGLLVAFQGRRGSKVRLDQPLGPGAPGLGALAAAVGTFHLTCFGWLIFRSESLEQLRTMATALVTDWSGDPVWNIWMWPAVATVVLEWVQRRRSHALDLGRAGWGVRWGVALLVLTLIVLWGRIEVVPFIYFQF